MRQMTLNIFTGPKDEAANDNHDYDEWKERFEQFHSDNPHVFALLEQYAFDAIVAGYSHYSIQAVFERMRWHTDIELNSDEPFKLNNNFRPFYARLFHRKHPQHDGFFRTREMGVRNYG